MALPEWAEHRHLLAFDHRAPTVHRLRGAVNEVARGVPVALSALAALHALPDTQRRLVYFDLLIRSLGVAALEKLELAMQTDEYEWSEWARRERAPRGVLRDRRSAGDSVLGRAGASGLRSAIR